MISPAMARAGHRLVSTLCALTVLGAIVASPAGAEATRPPLGEADDYAVVADQAVSSIGTSTITGSLAIAATTVLTGFPPGTISGETHLADATAVAVAGDTTTVNQHLKGQPCNSDRSGQDQGGLRLGEMVYCYNEPATLDGELRFDALGDPTAVWVIQVAGSYDVAAGSAMILANGAQACNVFWQATGSITIGAGATVVGTFLSDENIVLGDGATVQGSVFAPQGRVTMTNASVSQAACSSSTDQVTTTTTTPPTTDTTAPATPTPTVPGGDSGSDSGTGTGTGSDGTGSGDGGLAATGPVSMLFAVLAVSALGLGNMLIGGERVARWNARRWRPRHAKRRFRG
jgi:hypothetical protein